MSRARNLAGFGSAVTSVENPVNIQVGYVTAIAYYGDGSELTGTPGGLGTALSDNLSSPLNKIYYTNANLSIASTITVDPPQSASAAYTQYTDIVMQGDADLIVGDGDDFIPDILGIGTFVDMPGVLSGGNSKVRADNYTDKLGTGAAYGPYGFVTPVGVAVTVGSGTSISSPATNTLALGTNGTEKLRITSGGNIGIGSDSPGQKLVVQDNVLSGTSNVYINNIGGDASLYMLNNDQYSAGLGTFVDNGSYIELSGKWSSANLNSNRTFGRIGAFKENNTSADGSGYLALYSRPNGAGLNEGLRITSGGNVGINSTIPRSRLDVVGDLSISNINNQGDIQFYQTGTTNQKALIRMDQVSGTAGELQFWTETGDTLTQRVTITSTGNLKFNQSGNGIDFSATSDAPGETSELLDDYEEGTWTPALGASMTLNSGTWGANGYYTKIGNIVTLEMKQTGGNVSWNSGALIIGGVPFTPGGSNGAAGCMTNTSPSISINVLQWSSGYIYAAEAGASQTSMRINITFRID